MRIRGTFLMAAGLGLLVSAGVAAQTPNDWPAVGNDPGSQKYSLLAEITPANVVQPQAGVAVRPGRAGEWLHGDTHRHREHDVPAGG